MEDKVQLPVELQKRLVDSYTRYLQNDTTLRREAIARMLSGEKDINYECGYPNTISKSDYKTMYDREGVAKRVVRILPEECWKTPPDIFETEDPSETEFEKRWQFIKDKRQVLQYMQRIDALSGIGQFGILILGINDGKDLSAPVEGVNLETGEKQGNQARELLYLKAVDESVVTVKSRETSVTSPRYQMPTEYGVEFDAGMSKITKSVHWTRVVHVADNREASETYGVPRMQTVYNRLLDLRKVLAGSAEMFWKGGFPGYTAVFDPQVIKPEMIEDQVFVDDLKKNLKEQVQLWHNSMQRIFAAVGMELKSLAPQVADARSQFDTHLKAIAISLGIPYRIFLGTEEAKLASSQDVRTWNSRLRNRQVYYLDPMLIRPTIDRFIAVGILPEAEYQVDWPDLDVQTEQEQAQVAKDKTEAMAKFVAGDVSSIMTDLDFFTRILNFDQEEAEAIVEAAAEQEESVEETPENPLIPMIDDGTQNRPIPNIPAKTKV